MRLLESSHNASKGVSFSEALCDNSNNAEKATPTDHVQLLFV